MTAGSDTATVPDERASADSPFGSRLYVGTVSHERRFPRRNRFRYGIYFLFLDLDELDDLDGSLRRFGHDRRALTALYDVDHGPRDGTPLRPWIDGVLAEAGIDLEGGRVFLLTFPRVWRGRFYPVSFWYCFHADGTARAVLAEVHNTFGEHHSYLLHDGGSPMSWAGIPTSEKVFYVSPFIPMRATYRFRFSEPGDTLSVSIMDNVADPPTSDGERPLLLIARIDLEARPLTDAALLRAVTRYGPMSARAWTLIVFNALRLVLKRVPIVSKPQPPAEEVSL